MPWALTLLTICQALVKATAGLHKHLTHHLTPNYFCCKYLLLSTLYVSWLNKTEQWRDRLVTCPSSADGIIPTLPSKAFVYLFIHPSVFNRSASSSSHQHADGGHAPKTEGLKKEFKPRMCLLGTLIYTRLLSMRLWTSRSRLATEHLLCEASGHIQL